MARTARQQTGDDAESLVAARLSAHGWQLLGRNVHVGRSELDIVAVDPGPPARLVVVEVRRRASRAFGGAEESFGFRKRGHLRRGIGRLLDVGTLPDGTRLPPLPISLDLVVVESGGDGLRVLLYRDALA
jgi:putative endonuclease